VVTKTNKLKEELIKKLPTILESMATKAEGVTQRYQTRLGIRSEDLLKKVNIPESEESLRVKEEKLLKLRCDLIELAYSAIGEFACSNASTRLLGFPTQKTKRINILSLDGGGMKGLVLVELLHKIECLTGKRIFELFDIICGTSTGGILALAVGGMKKPLKGTSKSRATEINTMRDFYLQLGKTIFQPRELTSRLSTQSLYDSGNLKECLRRPDAFGEHKMEKMEGCPHLITVSAEIKQNTITPFIFRNYNVQNSPYKGTCEARMWEAALATASAPVFFQPYSFSEDQTLVDGGLGSNNPTLIALSEARSLWPDANIGCVVSLGCGDLSNISFQETSNFQAHTKTFFESISSVLVDTVPDYPKLMGALVELATSSESSHHALNLLWKGHCDYYVRLNPPLKHYIKMDETEDTKLRWMIYDAQEYQIPDPEKLKDSLFGCIP